MRLASLGDGKRFDTNSVAADHDIKPDNILLTSDRKTCKIADFGVSAMFVRPGDDTSLRSMGSPAFASPELCGRHAAADHHISGRAADIWAMDESRSCVEKTEVLMLRFRGTGDTVLYGCWAVALREGRADCQDV